MAEKLASTEKVFVISFMYNDGSGYKVIRAYNRDLKALAEFHLLEMQNANSDGVYRLSEVSLFGLKDIE